MENLFSPSCDLDNAVTRLETILIGVAGTIIVGGAGVILTILMMH